MSNFVRDITNFDIDDLARRFRRHSYFIKSLKFIFPVIAFVFIALLIIFPNLSGNSKKILIEPITISNQEEIPAMINPRFNGFDADNQPYNISATRAYQIEKKTILMHEISADISMADGTWASILTPEGVYKLDAKTLDLTKDFEIFITREDGSDLNIYGNNLHLELGTEVITSTGAVRAESPMGKLTAHGFTIRKKEGIIRFGGRVKLLVTR